MSHKQILNIIFTAVLMLILLAVPQSSVAHAQAGAPVPLSPDLTWLDMGTVQKNVSVIDETLNLNGQMYQAEEQFASSLPGNVASYYGTANLTNLGWIAVGGIGMEAHYWHEAGRFLAVRIAPCADESGEVCINVWESVYSSHLPSFSASGESSESFADPLPVPAFRQRDYNNTLGSGTGCPTIAQAGCWVTAYAMIYNYYQAGYTNPASLNTAIINANLYVQWDSCKDIMPWAPPVAPSGVSFSNSFSCSDCVSQYGDQIDAELANGRPVLAYDENAGPGHMVVITGHKNGDYQINDPWDGSTNRTLSTGALGSYTPTLLLFWNGDPPSSEEPTGFSKISPDDTFQPDPASVTFSWEDTANDKLYYCVEPTDGSAPCSPNTNNWERGYGTTATWPSALNAGTQYRWQVQAWFYCPPTCGNNTFANDGDWWTFTTAGNNYTISGNTGVGGVTLSGGPQTVTSDTNGDYSITIPEGQSVTIRPSKTGFTFNPAFNWYDTVMGDISGQDYTPFVKITGKAGMQGVTLSYINGTPKTVMSNANGNYTIPKLPWKWSGTVTPSKTGFTFLPVNRSYPAPGLQTSAVNQNYTPQVQISGNIGTTNVAGASVTYTINPATTPNTAPLEGNGSYTFKVPYQSTGTVTPAKACYTFSPASQTYSGAANQTLPNFTISFNTYSITGHAGADVTLSYTDGTPKTVTTDINGNYTIPNLPCGWSGTVTPSKSGSMFYPVNRSYTNLQSNKVNQTFTSQYQITGQVSGAPGVMVTYKVGLMEMLNEATMGPNGTYTITAPYGLDITVTPIVSGYSFTPSSMYYPAISQNFVQDYTGLPTISGQAGAAGATLSYTDGTPKTVTIDSSGYYSFGITPGWSGTVTISKPNVTFSVTSRTYTNVTTPQSNQNYPVQATFTSSPAYDGWVLESSETSSIGGSIDSTATTLRVGDDAAKRQYRAILSFATGGLPNVAVIQSAVLKVKQCGAPVGADPFTELGSLVASIREGTFGTAALQMTDFEAAASASTAVGTFNETPVDSWYSANLNATGRGYINAVSGATQFRLRFTLDDNNDANANYMKFCSGDAATSENHPELIINYLLP